MIDNRFPKRPSKIQVRLYPRDKIFLSRIVSVFNKICISDYFTKTLGLEKVFFANSGTEALIAWIRAKFDYKLKIAIPSFFCPHVAHILYSERHDIVLYDISEKDFFISEESLSSVLSLEIDLFILPSFFGYRTLPKQKIDLLKEKGINIVVDLAQSFPLEKIVSFHDEKTSFLFSFGKSKALATLGGGAIIPSKNSETLTLHFQNDQNSLFSNFLKKLKYSFKAIDLESDLQCLLHKKFSKDYQEILVPLKLSKDLSVQVNYSYQKYLKNYCLLVKRYKDLKNIFLELGKEEYLKFCQGIQNAPTILALNIKDKSRYDFSAMLASYGIETTWYYYPLHLMQPYRDNMAKERCSNTEAIARNILIIPFSLHQSNQEFNQLSKALKKVL